MTPATTRVIGPASLDAGGKTAGAKSNSTGDDDFDSALFRGAEPIITENSGGDGTSEDKRIFYINGFEAPQKSIESPLCKATPAETFELKADMPRDVATEDDADVPHWLFANHETTRVDPPEIGEMAYISNSALVITERILADSQSFNPAFLQPATVQYSPEASPALLVETNVNVRRSTIEALSEKTEDVSVFSVSNHSDVTDSTVAVPLPLSSASEKTTLGTADHSTKRTSRKEVEVATLDHAGHHSSLGSNADLVIHSKVRGLDIAATDMADEAVASLFQGSSGTLSLLRSSAPAAVGNDVAPVNRGLLDRISRLVATPASSPRIDRANSDSSKAPLSTNEESRSREVLALKTYEPEYRAVFSAPILKEQTLPVYGALGAVLQAGRPFIQASTALPGQQGVLRSDEEENRYRSPSVLKVVSADVEEAWLPLAEDGIRFGSKMHSDLVLNGDTPEVASETVAPDRRTERQPAFVPDAAPSNSATSTASEPLPTPAQQIISELSHRFAQSESRIAPEAKINEAKPEPLVGTAVKVFKIRLQPETLGDVEVTLRRRGTEVKVGLLVSSEATATALRQDLGTLQDRLISSLVGDTVPIIEISVRDPATQSQTQYQAGGGAGGGYNLSGGNDTGSNRRPSSDRNADGFATGKGDIDENLDGDRRSYSGVVV